MTTTAARLAGDVLYLWNLADAYLTLAAQRCPRCAGRAMRRTSDSGDDFMFCQRCNVGRGVADEHRARLAKMRDRLVENMTNETCNHTFVPSGYAPFFVWVKRLAKTHTQHRCPGCGLWMVWVRRLNRHGRRRGVPRDPGTHNRNQDPPASAGAHTEAPD